MSTKISALPASAGLSLSDIFPVVDDPAGTPVTQKATFSQLQTLLSTGGPFVLKAGDTMTGALTIGNGILVASAPVLNLSQTWNNAAVTFTGVKLNVTNTASNAASLIFDIQKNAVSVMSLRQSGQLVVPGTGSIGSVTVNNGILIEAGGLFTFAGAGNDILFNEGQTSFLGSGAMGFFSVTPVVQQAASSLDGIFTALKNYGLLTAGSAMTGQLALPVGSAAAPSLTFTGDLDTGVYHPAADEVGLSAGGTRILTALATGLNLNNITAPGADPTTSSQQWAAGGEWQYRSSTASEGAGQTNRVHNRAAQALGDGTDYTLTLAPARVDFGTTDPEVILPTAGTYLLIGSFQFLSDALSTNDIHAAFFRNSTDAVTLSHGQAVTLGVSFYGTINMSTIVTITASKTFQLWAYNITAARGTVLAANTAIRYVRLY